MSMKLVILGLLLEGDKHPYEVQHIMKERQMDCYIKYAKGSLYYAFEQLEKQGVEVYFSSTTRSPIMQGQAIESICLFKDNYGLNMNNYAYNVKHQEFDRVFLIIETAKDSVDPLLFEQIKNLEIISYEC